MKYPSRNVIPTRFVACDKLKNRVEWTDINKLDNARVSLDNGENDVETMNNTIEEVIGGHFVDAPNRGRFYALVYNTKRLTVKVNKEQAEQMLIQNGVDMSDHNVIPMEDGRIFGYNDDDNIFEKIFYTIDTEEEIVSKLNKRFIIGGILNGN